MYTAYESTTHTHELVLSVSWGHIRGRLLSLVHGDVGRQSIPCYYQMPFTDLRLQCKHMRPGGTFHPSEISARPRRRDVNVSMSWGLALQLDADASAYLKLQKLKSF